MLTQLFKIIRLLNSETNPIQISLAICFGMLVGFTEIWSFHNLIILLIVLFLRINLSAFLLGVILFKSISYLLVGVFHKIGLALLTTNAYQKFWTYLYNDPVWRFDRINNTVVVGSLVVAIIGFLPLLFILNVIIKKYRKTILRYFQNTRFAKAMKSTKIYTYYRRITKIRDTL